jgi:hypothetical protein
MGELQFLHELLAEEATSVAERQEAIESWCGPASALRDFHNHGLSVEVKTSSSGTRHHVSMDQLALSADEVTLILCSVRARRDASAPLKLPDKVKRIEEVLADDELVALLRRRLASYGSVGYEPDNHRLYELQDGFFVERTALREITDSTPILRPSSFLPGQPPPNVTAIRYVIDVGSIPTLPMDAKRRVISTLLGRHC